MKKINFLKNILGSASFLAFCLCAISIVSVFGQAVMPPRREINAACVRNSQLQFSDRNCGQTIGSLRSAGLLIYGVELKPSDPADDYTLVSWLDEINQRREWSTKIQDGGFSAADGMNFLKERFKRVGDVWLEVFVGKITDEIYGRIPTQAEKDLYIPRLKDQKETYASMFLAEKNKLSKNSAERKAMINRVYQQTMGKDATAAELQYWQPRNEIHREIIDATRTYLYTPSGANDLKATVTRAYQAKYKNSPLVDSRIAKLTADYSKSKLIYVEMIKN